MSDDKESEAAFRLWEMGPDCSAANVDAFLAGYRQGKMSETSTKAQNIDASKKCIENEQKSLCVVPSFEEFSERLLGTNFSDRKDAYIFMLNNIRPVTWPSEEKIGDGLDKELSTTGYIPHGSACTAFEDGWWTAVAWLKAKVEGT